MAWHTLRDTRALRQRPWAIGLKTLVRSPVHHPSSVTVLADPSVIAVVNPAIVNDEKRAGLLAVTRRMTVFLMAALPIFVIAIMVLWAFRSASWSPVLLVLAASGTFVAGAVTTELWRRLGRLSDLTAMNEELRYRATHDLLMHVPNRDQLYVELAQALTVSGGQAGRVGLLFLDLDRFKFVNDSLGHAAGDELLKAVGLRIKRALADENAMLARVGGDELIVLMRSLKSVDHLGLVADRVLAKFVDPFTIDGVRLNIGTSIGMAVSVTSESAGDLYRHADAALYEAKERGRGQVVLADVDLRAKRDARVRTELALREAFEHEHIEAWFQPEVDLITGEIIAAEALARWRSADGIEIASSFIDVARRAGMLEQLMVEMAGQIWAWRRLSGSNLPVALNVSAAHLPSLLALHEEDPIGRPFVGMRLEIAETDIIHDFAVARQTLNRLRDLGAQVMLDDFGAGYSSLQMLSDLPIDGLKIDRSYVARIESDWRVRNLVSSLAEFARSTNMIVVAEGVETARQADFLTKIGIDRGQGFLFSKAIDADKFAALVDSGPLGAHLVGRF
jgi:diguanylate cyclase (GGDEF)-like protein